jgi:hypothetical protein
MMDARNTTLLGNQLGGDIHWNTCSLGTRVGNAGLVSTGNTRDGNPSTSASNRPLGHVSTVAAARSIDPCRGTYWTTTFTARAHASP